VAFVDGENIVLRAVGTDLDGDLLTYRWQVLSGSAPGTLSATTGAQVTWTAGAASGDVTIEVIANDGEADSIHPDTISLLTGTAVDDGEILGDLTWSLAESPFVVTDDIRVHPGVTLTIETGVDVYFRPALLPGSVVEQDSFVVRGTLAVSASPKGSGDIRMFGGRTDASVGDEEQWHGLVLQSAEDITLSGLQISDAGNGITNLGTGSFSLSDSAIRDCINGMLLVDPDGTGPGEGILTDTTLRSVEVSNNLANGILLNSSWVDMEDCTISSNGAMGLLVTASTDYTIANVRSCLVANNGTAGIGYNRTGFYFFDFRVSGCNIVAHPDENVAMNWGSCPINGFGAFEITGNYWGVNAGNDVQAIKNVMGGTNCSYDFDSWVPDVDWLNSPILMN
jgi:hypothetical protein